MRRTLIRTLTFIFGLYFILEFLLPKQYGGSFDKTAIHYPSVIRDAESGQYRLYYVGLYSRRSLAVGLATSTDGTTWSKYTGQPVLNTALLDAVDRSGFSSLCPLQVDDGYELYYLGHDMEALPHVTVCWATSADGLTWTRHGRVDFEGETPWRQRDELEESIVRRDPRYTKLQALAATVVDGKPMLFIAHTNAKGRTELLRAERTRTERTGTDGAWRVMPGVLSLAGLKDTQKIASLSYVEHDGKAELWMYVSDKKLFRAELGDGDALTVVQVLGEVEEEEEAVEVVEQETGEKPSIFARIWESGVTAFEIGPKPPVEPIFARLVAAIKKASEYEEPDPLADVGEVCVFADSAGYHLLYPRPEGKKTPEDEVSPMALYEISSADGFSWEFPKAKAYETGQVKPLLSPGRPSHPTYLSRGFEFMGTFLMVIGAFAIGLGGVNMGIMHARKIIKGGKGVYNNVLFFGCLLFMFTATMWGKPVMDRIKEAEATSLTRIEYREKTETIEAEYPAVRVALAQAYDFIFYNVQFNLGATLFSLVSFYMVGAAFRSFRAKSLEAGFLIVAATVVLLGQIPLGAQLGSWAPQASGKLLILFNAAAYRGVVLGMAVAAISTSVRLWLGLEKGMFHGT